MNKKVISLLVLVILVISFSRTPALAAINAATNTVKLNSFRSLDGSTGTLINYIEGTLTQSGPGLVAMSAETGTNTIVDTLTQTMYLQQQSGSSWVTVATIRKTEHDTDTINDFRSAGVVTGGVYRLLVVSRAYDTTNDYREGYSDPITIR